MAALQSYQVQNKAPKASHGPASSLKTARFQVALPITANNDTVDFGKLPSYAVPINAILFTDGTATLNVGTANSPTGFFAAQALTANVPARTALAPLLCKMVPIGGLEVTGTFTATGTAGTALNLIIEYVVEDPGLAYPMVPFP